jgi:hypothetical protein
MEFHSSCSACKSCLIFFPVRPVSPWFSLSENSSNLLRAITDTNHAGLYDFGIDAAQT